MPSINRIHRNGRIAVVLCPNVPTMLDRFEFAGTSMRCNVSDSSSFARRRALWGFTLSPMTSGRLSMPRTYVVTWGMTNFYNIISYITSNRQTVVLHSASIYFHLFLFYPILSKYWIFTEVFPILKQSVSYTHFPPDEKILPENESALVRKESLDFINVAYILDVQQPIFLDLYSVTWSEK